MNSTKMIGTNNASTHTGRPLVLVPGTARADAAPAPSSGRTTFLHVIGTRPNFVKMAPIVAALAAYPDIRQVVVHTGQHYDRRMSEEVLSDLNFPEPDVLLGAGGGSHGEQTAKVLTEMERVLLEYQPVAIVVAGDVNSTLAAALAASKLGIPIAHIESGLRSGDWSMPEEVNRVLTDSLSDLLFTHSPECQENLAKEGISGGRVHYVGNTMIDSLRRCERKARGRAYWTTVGVREREYLLVTLHRPSNVDNPDQLRGIVASLIELADHTPIVFPIHPRTRTRLEADGALARLEAAGVRCIEPVGYLDFLSLQSAAGAIVTDSGGVQEEASALGVSCFTFRPNTERPVTLTHGTNTLLGEDPASLLAIRASSFEPTPCVIPLWDGHAAVRVAEALVATYALTTFASAASW
jgi:UDP-N-acetylglucosamine 2-epimerase (non-hydrolysing)